MAQWSKTFTNIDDVNNGQEFEDTDYPTKEAFNVALNNTQALKERADAKTITIISSGGNRKAIITKSGLYAVIFQNTQITTDNRYSTVISVDLNMLDSGKSILTMMSVHADNAGYVQAVKVGNEHQINLTATTDYVMTNVKLIVEY